MITEKGSDPPLHDNDIYNASTVSIVESSEPKFFLIKHEYKNKIIFTLREHQHKRLSHL